jgi:hypothetical protein
MRVRKIINLYSDEPTHVELLEYLDGIEGDSRRHQALVQMALIGFRVVDRHESGDEAFFRMRNPDASGLIGNQKPRMIRGLDPVERKPVIPRKRTSIEPAATSLIEGRLEKPATAEKTPVLLHDAGESRHNERSHTYTRNRDAVAVADNESQEEQEQEQEQEIMEVIDPMALLKQIYDES